VFIVFASLTAHFSSFLRAQKDPQVNVGYGEKQITPLSISF